MRWLMALILVALLVWHLSGDPEPVPIEETFIAEPIKKQQEFERMEDQVLERTREQQERMERQLEDTGG